jgi:hypothetical protein
MEQVNPDLVVRDKQGRSYAACCLSDDLGYEEPLPILAYDKSGRSFERPLFCVGKLC